MSEHDTSMSGEEFHALHKTSSQPQKNVTISAALFAKLGILVVLCGLSFFAGTVFEKGHTQDTHGLQASNGGFGGGQRSAGFGGDQRRAGTIGHVTAVSDTSITVNDQQSGSSKTYTIDSSTAISKDGQAVAASTITTSDTVLVMTGSSSDTSATRILVNPNFGGGLGGPDPSSNAATN